jgi:hypothetical protein
MLVQVELAILSDGILLKSLYKLVILPWTLYQVVLVLSYRESRETFVILKKPRVVVYVDTGAFSRTQV